MQELSLHEVEEVSGGLIPIGLIVFGAAWFALGVYNGYQEASRA